MLKFLITGLALLAAAPAEAATVTGGLAREQYQREGGTFEVLQVRYVAAPGEVNDLTLDAVDGGVRFRDAAVALRATGPGCVQLDANTVACRHPALRIVETALGDGEDRVSNTFGPASVDLGPGRDTGAGVNVFGGDDADVLTGENLRGGPGDDVLTVAPAPGSTRSTGTAEGGPGADRITGSDGRDLLDGGAGVDELLGGGGDDLLYDGDARGPVSSDLLDGGEGRDTAGYGGRAGPVRVDLAAGVAGVEGENDRLAGVERGFGGDHDDVLVGDPGDNDLWGNDGDDTIDGGAGQDVLSGEEGDDRLAGGEGDDRLDGGYGADSLDGAAGVDKLTGGEGVDLLLGGPGEDALDATDYVRDRVDCGDDADTATVTRGDDVAATCERVTRRALRGVLFPGFGNGSTGYLRLERGRRVLIEVLCVDTIGADCRGSAELWIGGRRVASGRFPCPADGCRGEGAAVMLRIPRKVLARYRGRRSIRVETVIGLGPGLGRGGIPVRDRATLRLR